jgi:dTDP-4-amino-4,6-dideoxygalactose transaminase
MSRDAWKRYGKGGSWFYEVVRPGFKCNMTDIQASLGLHQLTRLAELQDRRQAVVEIYQDGFADLDSIELPCELTGYRSAWHLYPIRLHLDKLTIDRSAFIDELGRHNIGTSVHFIPGPHPPVLPGQVRLSADRLPSRVERIPAADKPSFEPTNEAG